MELRRLLWILVGVVGIGQPLMSQGAIETRYNGFGDISVGMPFGPFASPSDRDLFDGVVGGDQDPKGTNRGFVLGGLDSILTVDISKKVIFQAEVNLQTGRGTFNEIEIDVERMYVDYIIIPEFNVMAGLYFTPIGYVNRNLYARAWMMNSIRVRDMAEEELGLMPTHSTGINFHGIFSVFGDHSLMYAFNVSNGRSPDPTEAVYARDPDPWKETSLLLEYRHPGFENLRVGVSAWYDRINVPSYASSFSGTTTNVKFQEVGYDGYVVIDNGRFGLLTEYAIATSTVRGGTLGESSYQMQAITAELVAHLGQGKWHPYVRYDQTMLPGDGNSDSYWNNRGSADQYVPEFKGIMTGVAYDLTDFNRLKFEYLRHLDGPRKENAIAFQSAFAF